MLRYDATAVLKDVNVPALVVARDRDSVCKSEASERMRRNIPDAQLTRLVPAKHMGLIEHRCRLFIHPAGIDVFSMARDAYD
jgi:pimeloyl-ACP methyl ester carboxylesterase